MFKKIKSFFRLENLKNIASVLTGLSLTVLAGVFLYMTIYETGNDVDVIGEAKIEIPKVRKFYIKITGENTQMNTEINSKLKEKINAEYSDFNLNEYDSNKKENIYFYNESKLYNYSSGDLVIFFNDQKYNDSFEKFVKFINDNYENKVKVSSVLENDDNFVPDEKILTDNALQDAKEKASRIADASGKKLGKISRINADYTSATSKKGDFFEKRIRVTYKLK